MRHRSPSVTVLMGLSCFTGCDVHRETEETIPSTVEDPTVSSDPASEPADRPTEPEETIPGHTHRFGSGEVTVSPACGKKGTRTFRCDCGQTKTESIPALEHVLETLQTTDATCTQDGVKVSKCSLCGVEKRQTIGALGHDWKTDVTSQPTCTQSGTKETTCTRCGESVMVDMRDRIGAPVDDPSVATGDRLPSNKVAFAFAPMNDMYMKFCWSAKNNSGKTIKYYTVTFEFHNRVGDLILTKNS